MKKKFGKNNFFIKKSIFDQKMAKIRKNHVFLQFMIYQKNALKTWIFVQNASKKFWEEFLNKIFENRRVFFVSTIPDQGSMVCLVWMAKIHTISWNSMYFCHSNQTYHAALVGNGRNKKHPSIFENFIQKLFPKFFWSILDKNSCF